MGLDHEMLRVGVPAFKLAQALGVSLARLMQQARL